MSADKSTLILSKYCQLLLDTPREQGHELQKSIPNLQSINLFYIHNISLTISIN